MTNETTAERAVFQIKPRGVFWDVAGPGLENASGFARFFDRHGAENACHLLTLAVRAAVGLPPVAPDDEPEAMFRLRLAAVRDVAEAMGRVFDRPRSPVAEARAERPSPYEPMRLRPCPTCGGSGRVRSECTDEPRRSQSDITAEATARAIARNPINPPVEVGQEKP